jgi:hypothetical protein
MERNKDLNNFTYRELLALDAYARREKRPDQTAICYVVNLGDYKKRTVQKLSK